jgi:putative zinc finger/helix-turn-helix YgiT family protein
MHCIECDALMVRGPVTLDGAYRGQKLRVSMEDGWSCPSCGYATISGRQSEEFSRRVRDEFRKASGQLEPEELREKRTKLGLTQERFAEVFDVAIASLKRWESGEVVPEKAWDQLLRIKLDPQYAESFVQESAITLSCLSGLFRELPVATLETHLVERPFVAQDFEWSGPVGAYAYVHNTGLNIFPEDQNDALVDSGGGDEELLAAANAVLELAA